MIPPPQLTPSPLLRIKEATSEQDLAAFVAFLTKLVTYLPPASLASASGPRALGGPLGHFMQMLPGQPPGQLPRGLSAAFTGPRGPAMPGARYVLRAPSCAARRCCCHHLLCS